MSNLITYDPVNYVEDGVNYVPREKSSPFNCGGCAFEDDPRAGGCADRPCFAIERADGKNIIWKEATGNE